MSVSVHDNWLYGHAVDHERRRIVLHTVYPHVDPWEFTDIVFEDVIHHFEQQKVGGEPSHPQNLLFDVEEADPRFVLGQYDELLSRTKRYSWPVVKYERLDDLIEQLTAGGAKCFHIHETVGLNGFVFAHSMRLRSRATRADVVVDAA